IAVSAPGRGCATVRVGSWQAPARAAAAKSDRRYAGPSPEEDRTMRLPLTCSLLALAACASPLPQPAADQAWVELPPRGGYTLMAHRLDDQRWPDGRYFQVTPGAHQLDVRFQFEVAGGGGDEFNGG